MNPLTPSFFDDPSILSYVDAEGKLIELGTSVLFAEDLPVD